MAIDRSSDEVELRPECWALAEDTERFYNFVSAGYFTDESLGDAKGIIRFAGDALTDPESFDYIDINPYSLWSARRSLELHKRTKKPLVATVDNWYPRESDRSNFLAITDNTSTSPQWILTEKELKHFCPWMPAAAFRNAREVAERLQGIRLKRAPLIEIKDAERKLNALVNKGIDHRKAMGMPFTKEYSARLDREMALIKEKGFESYFVVVADLCIWAKKRMLVGPARGSSAGSLVCYLIGITEVDPIPHGLLFERFIDINRADFPDIDIDFSDSRRHLVFEYLAKKYGDANVARLGNVSNLRARSVLAECGKRLGISINDTFSVKNVLIEHSSGDSRYGHGLEDTLELTNPGKEFMSKHPYASVMTRAENHPWHTSIHAAGVLVSNEPITNYCCVRDGVTELDKADSEKLGLLKIDALGLRTLGILEDAGVMESEDFYNLNLDSADAFNIINDRRFAGVFQFEGPAQRRVSMQIHIENFKQLDHITALARPGPLGGGAAHAYVDIDSGRKQPEYAHPSMEEYLSDTNGVVLYQEQVMRIVKELGDFSWEDTSTIRKAMSGRKGVEFFNRMEKQFVKGAAKKNIAADNAKEIWSEICNFGAWGMNKSHTCSYAVISYWCAWMKANYPLEFAAALLRSAKDDEQTIEVLRELADEGISYTAFDKERSMINWEVIDGELIGGFTNLKGIGPAKATGLIQRRSGDGLTEKDEANIAKCELKFTELYEARARWADYYQHPSHYNIRGPVLEFGQMADKQMCVTICKLVGKDRRDENEAVRINNRGGKRWHEPNSLFLNAFVVDDSVSQPVTLRIRTYKWFSIGEKLADRGLDGKDWFLVRGRWLEQFNMFICDKIKCLTNEEMFK